MHLQMQQYQRLLVYPQLGFLYFQHSKCLSIALQNLTVNEGKYIIEFKFILVCIFNWFHSMNGIDNIWWHRLKHR